MTTQKIYFSRTTQILSAVMVFVSLLMEPDGVGFSICFIKHFTGLDCPSCGLTRSFASLAHGEFKQSIDYHPFGVLLYPGILIQTVCLLSKRFHNFIQELIWTNENIFDPLMRILLVIYFLYWISIQIP